MNNQKSVTIFFYEGHLGVAPTLLNMVQLFQENLYDVKIITRTIKGDYADFNLGEKVEVDFFLSTLTKWQERILFFCRHRTHLSFKAYYQLENFFLSLNFIRYCRESTLKNNRSSVLIGVDTIGIIAACRRKKEKIQKLIYLSLEIEFLKNYPLFLNRIFKFWEILAHRKCFLTVIQDIGRFKLLAKENFMNWQKQSVYLLPNSPTKRTTNNEYKAENYFVKKLGLEPGAFIVLSAGMIGDEVYSMDIARACKHTNSYKLVFHERRKRVVAEDIYLQQLIEAGGDCLFLSLTPLPYNFIDDVFLGTDVGLALYNSSFGGNFENILFASGKISHYLKFGKPVIVNDLPGMRPFFEQWQCGVVINDICELNHAIEKIKANYSLYSANASRCFNVVFDFERNFNGLLKQL